MFATIGGYCLRCRVLPAVGTRPHWHGKEADKRHSYVYLLSTLFQPIFPNQIAFVAIVDVCAHLQPTMGSLVSKAKLFLYATIQLGKTYDVLRKRIETSPGVPVDNPTLPLWTVPRAQIPVDETGLFPQHVDVVIIGSGITGTSFAYNALSREAGLKIAMLEARDVCSGATGR